MGCGGSKPPPPAKKPKKFTGGVSTKNNTGRDPNLRREDYIVAKRTDATVVKPPGAVNGQQFVIENCARCVIYVLDRSAAVTIDECEDCTIVLGPCETSVFVRDCKNCAFAIACRQVRHDAADKDLVAYQQLRGTVVGMYLCLRPPVPLALARAVRRAPLLGDRADHRVVLAPPLRPIRAAPALRAVARRRARGAVRRRQALAVGGPLVRGASARARARDAPQQPARACVCVCACCVMPPSSASVSIDHRAVRRHRGW